MKVAYERVSTTGQSTLRQDVIMQEHKIDKVFIEKISGKDRNRPELQKMLDFVREGDTIVIESISRLARSTRDFLNILDELEKKHVALVSLKEQIDTATPTGRFLVPPEKTLKPIIHQQFRFVQSFFLLFLYELFFSLTICRFYNKLLNCVILLKRGKVLWKTF